MGKNDKKDEGSFLEENLLQPMVSPQDLQKDSDEEEKLDEEPEDEQPEIEEEEESDKKARSKKSVDLPKDRPKPPASLKNTRPRPRDYRGEGLPNIDVYDNQGALERRKRAVDLGLSERVLPPLTKGRAAVYKWIDEDRIDPLTGLKPEPKDPILPGTYLFVDKYQADPTKRSVLMRNLGRPQVSRDGNGREIIEKVTEEVMFTAGLLRVVPEVEYHKYLFMELHPLNKSNQFRSPGGPMPKFERIDIKANKSAAFDAALADLAFMAEREVVDIIDRDTIIGYAAATGEIQTAGILTDRIKTDLRIWARKNPRKFFSMHNNVEVPAKLNLLDAISLGIIVYQPDKKRYIDPEADKEIFTHSIQEDPFEALVAAMIDPENKQVYDYIVALLNYWERGDE